MVENAPGDSSPDIAANHRFEKLSPHEYPADLQKAIAFHGHFCPGLAIGYRAARTALQHLGVTRAEDEELVAIVESDGCGIDAVQALAGCTIGKGNLIFRDYGKQAYTLACRRTNQAVRIAVTGESDPLRPEQEQLKTAVWQGQATPAEEQEWHQIQQARIARLLSAPEEKLFKIESLPDFARNLPEKAQIFPSVICAYCGEKVMEARARLRNGKIACLACTTEYHRGW
ncbi:MAG TPA: FmdE family protein [Patescibacteria group bacterium]|nr:FmdE family protein [Patescibacteria group bacterium]